MLACRELGSIVWTWEITSYTGPFRMTDVQKLSPLNLWRRNVDTYPCMQKLLACMPSNLTHSASPEPAVEFICRHWSHKMLANYQLSDTGWINSHLLKTISPIFSETRDRLHYKLDQTTRHFIYFHAATLSETSVSCGMSPTTSSCVKSSAAINVLILSDNVVKNW